MIYGVFHQGSGLGNQLHRYVATRVLALDKGYKFGMIYHPDGSGKEPGFKGKNFMDLDTGELAKSQIVYSVQGEQPNTELGYWEEKRVNDDISGVDIRSYDPEINFLEDNTIIEGEFQDERYWEHREREVDEWLKVEPLDMPDDLCAIGFRGGEFAIYSDLFLTKEYWDEGIKMMREINPDMKFQVHTDDKPLAQQFFPDFEVIHDVGINWRSMRYAKYAIIANSSFFILPRWLRCGEMRQKLDNDLEWINKGATDAITIAPRYWGRRNTKVWSLPQNYYKRFIYI